MKNFNVKVSYEYETEAENKEEAIDNVFNEIKMSNENHSLREHADVKVKEI